MPITIRNVCSGFMLCLFSSAVFAQQDQPPAGENPREAVSRQFAASGLRVGSPFPDLQIYDADGKPFRTVDLRGSYTVLVTGCLT